jgi:hypothetical protein
MKEKIAMETHYFEYREVELYAKIENGELKHIYVDDFWEFVEGEKIEVKINPGILKAFKESYMAIKE